VLILDTRPILDWFTEAAMLAADLVLTPVKDRASLVNAAALREILQAAGRAERLWLVPSLVDARARLNSEVRICDFLAFAARERDYQVTELMISKSPRVESLASGFSTRIPPVLTHARQTAVHSQMRQLAEFMLDRRVAAGTVTESNLQADSSVLARRRLVMECPVCSERAADASGHHFFDLRSRRRGTFHPACFTALLDGCELGMLTGRDDLLVMELAGPGMVDADAELQLHLFDAGNDLIASERMPEASGGPFQGVVESITGRRWQATLREWILVSGDVCPPEELVSRSARRAFALRRRRVLREAMAVAAGNRQSS